MLRPEVAEQFELTTGSTYVHVPQLGRDYDLTCISLEQAEELLAVPGFDRLRRKPAVPEVAVNDVGAAVDAAAPTEGKKKRKG